jgi:molybdopterin molybdotransferase
MAGRTVKKPPLELEEAQARLLAMTEPLPIERIDIDGALGRYLAQPLHARRTQPACALSAMDGYAVVAHDLSGPWQVIGESAAGHPHEGAVAPGKAVRIATGALVPDNAGAVILQEDLDRDGDELRLTGEPPTPPGKHIRPAGMDFCTNQVLLAAGGQLGPAQLALAVAGGHKHLPVRRKPRLAIIDSGDELAEDCEDCPPHQIPASNGPMLTAMARSLPCDVQRLGPVRDNLDALITIFDQAESADVIVTSGGASVGDHDLVRPALEEWGAEIDFWRVAIKPGKPLLVARRGRQLIIGLPGNPVSSHVTAYLFLLPVLRAMLGAAEPLPRAIKATLAVPVSAAGGRREFLRAQWDGSTILPLALQDSGALSALAASNALIDRPAGAGPLEVGAEVHAYLLQNGGIA